MPVGNPAVDRAFEGSGKDVDDDVRGYRDCGFWVRINEQSPDVSGGAHDDDDIDVKPM